MLQHIFFDILESSIAASVVIASVAWLFPYIDKRYSIRWRKAFWLLLSLRLLIPCNFSLPETPVRLFRIREDLMLPGIQAPVVYVLALVWGIGAFVYLRSRYLHYQFFKKEALEHSAGVTDAETLALLEEVKKELLISKEIILLHCGCVRTPMLFGVFSHYLLIPDHKYDREQLKLILIHECMHLDNRDIIYKMIMSAAAAMHWFNPLVHLLVKLGSRDVELMCDQCVVEDMDREQRGFYGHTILDAVQKQKDNDVAYTTCFYGSRDIMQQRIDHLFDMEKKKSGIPLFLTILVIFTVLSLMLSCG